MKPAARCFWFVLAFTGAQVAARGQPLELPKPRYTSIAPGLDYAHLRETNQPWSIHIARLDRRQKNLVITTSLARNQIQGLASLSHQMTAFPAARGQPLAAVNGDYFLIQPGPYQGDPQGFQILDGELVSAPIDKSFWVDARGGLHIAAVDSRFELTWPAGGRTQFYLNETPRAHRATLFTPAFGKSTAATNAAELILEKSGDGPWLPLRVEENYQARVKEIRADGNSTIPADAMVLSLTGDLKTNLAAIHPADRLQFTTATPLHLTNVVTAIGGGPILVLDGKEQAWPARKGLSDYLLPRHPRTALGFNRRYFFLVEVDGRQKELSVGLSFVELAALMKQLGCTDALNLDGGGSATFWLNGKVMNSPSDKHERSIANAVVIVRKP
ncbi:MAG: phosphodiester glycosidase family protein [Pedosphaera sp.]|nr:phosphodiester glycosidase family protein [Pedosphaera sp.]